MGGFLRRVMGSGVPTPDEQDQQVIAAIAGHGADLAQPREIIHYLYFTTEAATRGAVEILDRPDRFVHAIIDPDQGNSKVTIKHTDVLTIMLIRGLRSEFENAAKSFGGEYDGWEAAAAP